jgi:hypothetical protein
MVCRSGGDRVALHLDCARVFGEGNCSTGLAGEWVSSLAHPSLPVAPMLCHVRAISGERRAAMVNDGYFALALTWRSG